MPLPKDVKALGFVSLLNDASSEMIFPLLPALLAGPLHAGPAVLGLIEGAAETVASLLKVASGWLSDRLARRKPLVVAGYALAAAVRPWIALATAPWHVFAVRVGDRIGKGVRSAPRDALLAAVAPAGERGRAFGFHRSMDHAGAVVGPLLAAALLALTGELRLVFALAALPAILAVLALVFGVDEPPAQPAAGGVDEPPAQPAAGGVDEPPAQPAAGGVDEPPAVPAPAAPPVPAGVPAAPLPAAFKAYLVVLALFTLGCSSDAFLLLRAQDAGVPLAAVPLLWTLHHAVKSATGTWGGALSDRLGRRRAIVAGWFVYALVYLGFALASAAWQMWALFVAYGLHFALCEGAEKALVADLAGGAAVGRAFGLYHGVTGVMLLPASVLAGALWQWRGPLPAFGLGAALALVASLGLWLGVPEPESGRGLPSPAH